VARGEAGDTVARKILFYETGGPEVLKIVEVPTPEPGAGEIRIRVKAIGLNRSEVNFRAGTYGPPPALPAQLGSEVSGEVDAVGTGVTNFKTDDALSVIATFGPAQYGLYGDLVLAPARSVVKHPANLTWEEAAASWMPFTTAWTGLIDIAKLAAKDTVLITAASSGVGLAAIQMARQEGAIPIALTRRSRKADALLQAGAAHVIATEEKDVKDEVKQLTGGKGARVVFDAVGGPSFAKLVSATSMDGLVLTYGVLSKEMNSFPAIQVLRRRLTIRGFAANSTLDDDARLNALKSYILPGLASGAFKPRIAKTYPFESIVDAHRYLESNEQFGKVVVTT
jgi:NADPH:quinone reductase-like Zn-dependent oxidoreductase